jgi:hypothetical protein
MDYKQYTKYNLHAIRMSRTNATSSMQSASNESLFRIGAVSRATRIPIPTLRMWERRYGVVRARRTAKDFRLYDSEDLARLTIIKQLVDRGNAISTVANLGLDALRALLNDCGKLSDPTPKNLVAPRVVVVGDALSERIRLLPTNGLHIEVVAGLREVSELADWLRNFDCDAVICDEDAVDQSFIDRLREILRPHRQRRLIITYGFAQSAVFTNRPDNFVLVRRPVEISTLAQLCGGADVPSGQIARTAWLGEGIPPRRFDPRTLERLAVASTTIKCECPRHLVDLVHALFAFEAYSAQCANRNAKDAALHQYLYETTAQARALVEDALAHLAEVDRLL